jgi:hypothetical protein
MSEGGPQTVGFGTVVHGRGESCRCLTTMSATNRLQTAVWDTARVSETATSRPTPKQLLHGCTRRPRSLTPPVCQSNRLRGRSPTRSPAGTRREPAAAHRPGLRVRTCVRSTRSPQPESYRIQKYEGGRDDCRPRCSVQQTVNDYEHHDTEYRGCWDEPLRGQARFATG